MKTSKKQKEAIEMLDKFIIEHKLYNIKQSDGLEDNIKIVLYLIEKLQKENEYYKECLEAVSKHLDNIDYDQILFAIYKYYISKQKVKEVF